MGILSTASKSGEPNSALYAKPRFIGEHIGFIMLKKKTLANLQENPNACYLFAKNYHYKEGVRLYLRCVDLIDSEQKIADILNSPAKSKNQRVLALFEIVKSLQIASNKEFSSDLMSL